MNDLWAERHNECQEEWKYREKVNNHRDGTGIPKSAGYRMCILRITGTGPYSEQVFNGKDHDGDLLDKIQKSFVIMVNGRVRLDENDEGIENYQKDNEKIKYTIRFAPVIFVIDDIKNSGFQRLHTICPKGR